MTGPDISDAEIERIRAKYRAERDKRVGTPGRGSIELTGDAARFLVDPYAPRVERDPVNDEVDVVVVGAGLSGLLLGVRLREQGIRRIRLIDMASDVGGVWYWNRYPGAMCDVDSLIYMPLLEELGHIPSARYAPAAEIAAHARNIATHWHLYDDSLFQTTVESVEWDEAAARWHITTDRGDDMRARYTILANGPLSRLKLPDLPGIETFTGHSFHTSRWDYDYTGGSPTTPMDKLADKTVGVVGTGATGIQCVPPLGRAAKKLYVFQRTPSTVAVRANAPIDEAWGDTSTPGWQRRRQRNFTRILAGAPVEEILVQDGWTDLYGTLMLDPEFAKLPPAEAAKARERADFNRMEQVRTRVDSIVQDEQTAAKLKPWYAYLCKRPGFHDEYLAAFNLPGVTLVDTDGRGLERVYENGVVVNGEKFDLDCLIFATGFEFETTYAHRIGFEVTGRDGRTLTEKWAGGLRTLHGLMTHGFPNLFVMPGVNTQNVVTTNLVDTMQENAYHVAHIIGELTRRGARTFDVDPAAEDDWVNTIIDRALDRTAFLAECTPGRFNNEGAIDKRPKQNTNFGGGPLEFYALLRKWRKMGTLPGLEVQPETADAV